MATLTPQPGERREARPTRSDHTRPGTAVCKPRWSTYKCRARRKKNVSGNKLGQCPRLSHNPQRAGNIGERQRCPRSKATTGEQRANLLNLKAGSFLQLVTLHLRSPREICISLIINVQAFC